MFGPMKKTLIVAATLLSITGLDPVAQATFFHHRQYYSSWTYDPGHTCYYRYYYYQPTPVAVEYRYHVVYYYYASYPTYYYYYNPYSQVYWGRSPIKSEKPQYAMLKKEDRKKDLKDIPEKAFPEPTDPPSIPESSDKVSMELPPKDLPTTPKSSKSTK